MTDVRKTKAQLIDELNALRQRVSELERSEIRHDGDKKTQRRNDEWFRTWIDKLGYVVYETDDSGVVTYASKIGEELTGLPLRDIIGKPFLPLFSEESQQIANDIYRRTLKGESPEYELTFTNGKIGRFRNEPLRNNNGKIIGVFGIARDVTEYKSLGQALRESEENYRTLVEQSLQGVIISQGVPPRIVFANSAMAQNLGYTVDELMSLTPEETARLVHPEDRAIFFQRYRDRLDGQQVLSRYEVRGIRRDGMVRWFELLSNRIEYLGEPTVQAVFLDITERKLAEQGLRQALEKLEGRVEVQTADLMIANKRLVEKIDEQKRTEAALRESERRIRELADLLPQSVFESDEIGRITFFNRHAFGSTGYNLSDLKEGLDSAQLLIPEDRERCAKNIRTLLIGEEVDGYEYTALRKDGTTYPVAVYASPIIQDGKIKGLRGVAVDLTELKQKRDALRESEKKLRRVYSRILETQEEERKRLARELHDGLIQSLATLKLNSKTILGAYKFDNLRVKEIMERNISITSDMIEELRKITSGLRPGMLDTLGLIPTLESYMGRVFGGLNTKVHFRVRGFEERLDRDVEVNLYRIIQEALSNVVKHANANNVWLRLERDDSRVTVLIEDDGVGFDVEDSEVESAGQGLMGLRERVGLFDGRFSLDSEPGKGCRIMIEMNALP